MAVSLRVVVVGELGRQSGIGLLAAMTAATRANSGAGSASSTGGVTERDVVVLRIKGGPSTTAVTEIASLVARRTFAKAEEVGVTGARFAPARQDAESDQQRQQRKTSDDTTHDTTDETSIGAGAVGIGSVGRRGGGDDGGHDGSDDDLRCAGTRDKVGSGDQRRG